MLINRFDPPPRVWPPPRDAASIAECVGYAERRDPIGHSVHLALGCLYLFCMGLSTAAEGVAFVALIGYTLLRLPNLWRGLAPLLAAPVTWALLALFALMLASGLWAKDRHAWLDVVAGFRGVLLIPALYPIRRSWQPLIGSLIAGMSAQSVIQLLQQAGVVPPRDDRTLNRFAGLHSNPVHVSLFQATSFLCALCWMTVTRSLATRVLLVIAAALLACGVAIAAGRAAILGLAFALPLMALLLSALGRISKRRLAVSAIVVVVTLAIVGGLVYFAGGQGMRRQSADLFKTSDVTTTTGVRLLWWRAAWDAAKEHPLLGVGAGGTRRVLANDANVKAAIATHPKIPRRQFVVDHPHSMYLQTACELGVAGLVCLAAIFVAAGLGAWTRLPESPINAAVVAALVAWAIAAGFDALHMSGSTASLLGALVALGAIAGRDRHEAPRV